MFGIMLAFIPTLIAGIVIVILGIVVGEFVRGVIVASAGGVSGVPTVAKLAKGAVIIISLFMALQQVGVGRDRHGRVHPDTRRRGSGGGTGVWIGKSGARRRDHPALV